MFRDVKECIGGPTCSMDKEAMLTIRFSFVFLAP